MDLSINMISLFGFILVLGILVDDAIVVGENVYTVSRRDGHSLNNVIPERRKWPCR
jgi:multidrug efflux pump subunit AcrB